MLEYIPIFVFGEKEGGKKLVRSLCCISMVAATAAALSLLPNVTVAFCLLLLLGLSLANILIFFLLHL